MGKRGPKPKNKTKKYVIQNYTAEFSEPPSGMSLEGRKHWKNIVSDFPPGFHQPKHFPLLKIFCESFANWCKAQKQLSEEKFTILNDKTGIIKANPLIGIINAEVTKMNQLSPKLALTIPLDRPDADISFETQKTPEQKAYEKLLKKENELQGSEKTLFEKLRKIYGKTK